MMRTFCRRSIICLSLFLTSALGIWSQDTLVISEVEDESVIVIFDTGVVVKDYRIKEIYDVYTERIQIEGQVYLVGFVDSVYLDTIEKTRLVFNYVWEGERRNLSAGQFLQPTTRSYAVRNE